MKKSIYAMAVGLGLTGVWLNANEGTVRNLVVCANDQSVVYRENAMHFREEPGKGSLTVLDFSRFPPVPREIANVPVTVIGPPTCVAVIPGKGRAIVTSAMIVRTVDGAQKHVPDTQVALVDLDSGRVLGHFTTGLQPTGVTISPGGKIAYIANRADGSISVMTIGEDSLREKARVAVAEPADSLSHIEVSPDGRYAVATLTEAGAILVLKLDDGSMETVGRIRRGEKPYAARFLPGGRMIAVADIGTDQVTLYSFSDGVAEVVRDFPVGRIPEGIDISGDGEWIAVSCFDGANLTDATHPKFGEAARIYLLRKGGEGYQPAGTIEIEGAPQFAVFSPDGKYLTVSQTGLQRIELFRRNENGFAPTGEFFPLPGEPVAAGVSR
jgi:6-phosphogluconolactonase (cycloisomerase 2 family)